MKIEVSDDLWEKWKEIDGVFKLLRPRGDGPLSMAQLDVIKNRVAYAMAVLESAKETE